MYFPPFPRIPAVLAIAALLPVCTGIAVTSSNSTLEPRSTPGGVYTNCVNTNDAALTFNDGPYKYHLGTGITGIASTTHHKSFLFKNLMQLAIRSPPILGAINKLDERHIREEFVKINTALHKILGVVPSVIRPPYGNYNDKVRKVASTLGQSLVTWNFDSEDAMGATPAASKQGYINVANKQQSTIISLEHETVETTVFDVLSFAIQTLKAKGYNFVTISECLGIDAYKSTVSPSKRDATWSC